MRTGLIAFGVTLMASLVQAGECVWTGAANDGNKWATAGNWVGSSVPGAADTAVFGAMDGKTSADQVTVDLEGMSPIGGLRIENADAPAYVFGAANTLTKQDDTSPSNFKMANGATLATATTITIAEEVLSDQMIRVFWHPSQEEGKTKTYDVYFSFSNASERATLVFEKISRHKSTANHAAAKIYFYGRGDFSIGEPLYTSGSQPAFTVNSTGKLNWFSTKHYMSTVFSSKGELALAEGAQFGMRNGTRPFSGSSTFNEDVTITGAGKVYAFDQQNQKPPSYVGGDPSRAGLITLAIGKKVVSTAAIDGVAPSSSVEPQYLPFAAYSGSSTREDWGFYQDSSNNLPLAVHLYGKARFGAKKIGRNNCSAEETSVGRGGEITFMHYWTGGSKAGEATKIDKDGYACDAVLAYTGDADETIDRTFFITNSCADAIVSVSDNAYLERVRLARATLRTEGKGALVLDAGSQIRVVQSGARFTFDAATAPITFNGTFPSGTELAVKGEKLVTIGASAQLPDGLAVTLAGGVFCLNGKTGLSVESGENTVVVSGAQTLAALPAVPSGAALDFELPTDDDTVVVTGATGSTEVPDAITVNGRPARFTDAGQLVENSTRWKAATSGTWTDATKWSGDVPVAGIWAIISAAGDDYTVTLGATPETMPDKVEVGQGATGHAATLSVQADLSSKPTEYAVSAGGVLEVGRDGKISVDTDAAVIKTEAGSAVRVVSGGHLTQAKDYTLSAGSWLVKDDGRFDYGGTANAILRLQPEAGETVSLAFDTSDGKCQGTSDDYQGRIFLGGSAGASSFLSFNGWGSEAKNQYGFFADSKNPYGIFVGYVRGYGEMSVTNAYIRIGNYGLHVGVADTSKSAPLAATGVVNHVSGYVNITGSGAPGNSRLYGTVIGGADNYDVQTVPADQIRNKGTYNLQGGTLETRGYLIIGSGPSEGAFCQSGGTMKQTSSITSSENTNHLYRTAADPARAMKFDYPTLIGFQGGKGLYEITGGSATFDNSVFVATCFFDEDMPWGITKAGKEQKPAATAFPYDLTTGTEGCLRVRGGSVSIPDDCTVGKGGAGTIEMVGTAGALTVGTLVLTNKTQATVRFVYDAANSQNGVSSIAVTDRLVIDGATLEVDLGSGNAKRRVKLFDVDPSKIEGEFGSVVFTGEGKEQANIVVGTDGLYARVPSGIILIVR